MSCLDADTVLAWVDGQLAGERARTVEAHIDECAACRRVVSETVAAAATAAPSPQLRADALGETVAAGSATEKPPAQPGRRTLWLACVLAALGFVTGIAGIGAWRAAREGEPTARPVVARLIERDGQIFALRRGPDGIYVAAAFGDGVAHAGPGAIAIARRGSDGALAALGFGAGALLAAVGRDGALAVIREPVRDKLELRGRVALLETSGKPRWSPKDDADVTAAELLSDGSLAVVRRRGAVYRVEVLARDRPAERRYDSPHRLAGVRASRGGALAVVEQPADGPARVVVLEPGYPPRALGGWREASSAVWYGNRLVVAGRRGAEHALWLVEPGGAARAIWSSARPLVVHDVAPDGTLAVTAIARRSRLMARRADWPTERELSWLGESTVIDASRSGDVICFADRRGDARALYVRRLGDREPVALGDGFAGALDDDGAHVAVMTARRVAVHALASGWDGGGVAATRELPAGELTAIHAIGWRRRGELVIVATGPAGPALYTQRADGSAPPERHDAWPGPIARGVLRASPDGTRLAAGGTIVELTRPLAIRELPEHAAQRIAGWTPAGGIYLAALGAAPVAITARSFATDLETAWAQLALPGDALAVDDVVVPNATGYVYSYTSWQGEALELRGVLP